MRSRTMTMLCAAAAIAGCATLEEIAPPAERLLMARAAQPDGEHVALPDPSLLARGRELFVIDCARCHAVVPVRAHTRSEWAEIMPRMVKESNLGDAELRALEAYVEAVLTMP
jgi:mono/diheme cytochrome c family protein